MINVYDLHKSFGSIIAVDGVSFSVKKGEVLGFLGPNGAGKSTTMKMLSCFLEPDSGYATINNCSTVTDSIGVRKNLGYLAENAPSYEEMNPYNFLKFICNIRNIKGTACKNAIEKVAHECAISNIMYQQIGTLSKGYKRRVGLAQALIHNPDVLILDEPTDGLDPNQKFEVRQLIKKLAPQKAIIISTHILEEVDSLCSRLIIIANGKILVDSTPNQLRKQEQGNLDEIFRKITTTLQGVNV